MIILTVPAAFGQDPAVPPSVTAVEVEPVPDRFFPVQDSSGFFWQAVGNGALVSGDTQYLQSGLNLSVNGTVFAPVKAFVREPVSGAEKTDIRLEEKRPDLAISRDLWFDTRRSAVRVFDTVTNSSAASQKVSVSLRTTYPFAWQSLHGTGGALLSHDPTLQLGARDYSIGVHFSPTEGRHDTLFIVGSEKGGQMAELKASANSRELTFLYSLEIPPGESRSLLHWIMQRNLADVNQDLAAISPFIQRDKLIVPEIDPKAVPQVVNFARTAFQIEVTAPPQIKALVALNLLTDRIGFHRRSEDLMWISPTNQIAGMVKREGSLTIGTAFTGDQEVKFTEIAAITGGAGIGRNLHVYLRDGRVLVGPVRQGEIQWSIGTDPAKGPAATAPVDPSSLNLLLFATAPADGVAPAKTTHFLQLVDGSVFPLVMAGEGSIALTTPWGVEKWLWSDLLEAGQVTLPTQRLRAVHRDGSEVSGLLAEGSWNVKTAAGAIVEVPTVAINRIWTVGATGLTRVSGFAAGTEWLDFAEVPAGQGPTRGFLLSGNHLLEAEFAAGTLAFSEASQEWALETSRIASLRRSVESAGLIEVALTTGETLVGRLSNPYLTLVRNGVEVEIPSVWVISYRNAKP